MYNLKDITNVHLELTSKCQARCPMCPRRISGGIQNPLITLNEIDLETFKKWFPESFLKQLNHLFLCGNLGDPIIAEDCLPILQYVRQINPTMNLSMHTNGSARSPAFWKGLAEANVHVVFGIDGIDEAHSLYRIGTQVNKILKNAEIFIENGGKAEWHMLVFKHNEHQTGECQHMADQMGFKKFITKHTSRFVDKQWNVLDDSGRTTHILYPTEKSKGMSQKVKDSIEVSKPYINCKVKERKEIYIGSSGNVSPCCWLDFGWMLPSHSNRVDYMDRINMLPSLLENTLEEIFDSDYFNKISNTWSDNPLQECSKQCGQFDKCGAQFK